MQAIHTLNFMTKEESYADRRQLFKNIWDTAMNIDEKDDILIKPKVIKYEDNKQHATILTSTPLKENMVQKKEKKEGNGKEKGWKGKLQGKITKEQRNGTRKVKQQVLQEQTETFVSDGGSVGLCQDDEDDDAEDAGNKCLVCDEFERIKRTLRLDEVDKCIAGRLKKQRLKNLRHVCNKILDFCDRQDADNLNYEKMAAEGQVHRNKDETPKKKKAIRLKRKVKKTKSMFTPVHDSIAEVNSTSSEEKEEITRSKTSRNTSPHRIGRTPHVRTSPYAAHNIIKLKKTSKDTSGDNIVGTKGDASVSHRRIVKKKSSKRKKVPEVNTNLKVI